MTSKLYQAWLGHDIRRAADLDKANITWLMNIVTIETSEIIISGLDELALASEKIWGTRPVCSSRPHHSSFLYISKAESFDSSEYQMEQVELDHLGSEGFLIKSARVNGEAVLLLIGGDHAGILYGVFHLLRLIYSGHSMQDLYIVENPKSGLRMINQWDNVDGSIERGYAGQSIFYQNNQITTDMQRIKDYARMLCSVGINGISINNVNVHELETSFISSKQLPAVARIADVFRNYGIGLYLSVNFASPITMGGLETADPLDPKVKTWWKQTAESIYSYIPDFSGFLVKADSEHRPGPFTYSRSHADGANMLAEALEPFGGVVIWRCFVYNCMQDWRDRSTDRARAAYDHFKPLDGQFHENVILQIKNGPMDFQVREPVSPLFGAMTQTNQVLEFQITQEYTGQQRHVCYLVPQWKEILDFDTLVKGEGSAVKKIADGSLFGRKTNGFAAVSNIGNDENWTGHTLAQANLYGYGRIIWNPDLSAEQITEEWIRLTFNHDPQVVAAIRRIMLSSWSIYEAYTAPLGVGWMVNRDYHYGPDVDGYEYSRWGTYHFADRNGIGVDRTKATGTGYSMQYAEPIAEMYDALETCPDELLLFFHHVPYSHRLKSGISVIQHIYNTRFEGAEQAGQLLEQWLRLEGEMDSAQFLQVLSRLEEQSEHAKHWRDVLNTYFYRKSGVPDDKGRVIF